jgi:subtilisin family serine protease
MKFISALAFVCSVFYSVAQVKMSNADKAEIQTIISHLKSNKSTAWKIKYAINSINQVEYLSFVGKINTNFNATAAKENGILIGKPIDKIVSVRIPLNQLNSWQELVGFDYLTLSNKFQVMNDRGVKDMRADSVQQGIGLPEGYTGKDVYIGITDWGFDYTSPMFYDTSLTQTRIVAAWDQFKTSGPNPQDFNYGTEYVGASALLAAGSDTANIYSYSTHGTHVAGICGGSGAGTIYRGVAFESKFLFVTFLVDEAAVLDAWQWMYDKATADGKRLVINMSWGLYHFGTLDGTSTLSQAISAFSDLGVVFVNSGGNNGNVNFHIKKTFANNLLKSKVDFYSYTANANMWGQSIHAWGEVGESFESGIIVTNSSNAVLVESPFYNTNTTAAYIDTFLVTGTDTIWYNISADAIHPLNQRPQMRVRVKNTDTGLKVILKSQASIGTVHYWNVTELSNDVGNWGMPFATAGTGTTAGDNLNGISEPSCADDVISVAAYAPQYATSGGNLVGGAIASFSSIGPRYDGVMKPDIAAPGVSITSSISSFTNSSYSSVASVPFNNRTYHFAKFSGTSMASPMVAGVVALILDANPYLMPQQVKDIIMQTAREDNYTQVIPSEGSPKWGAGKINAYAAVQLALLTVGTNEIKQEKKIEIYPNPTSSELNFKGDFIPSTIELIDLNGRILKKEIQNGKATISELKAGTYFIRFLKEGKVYQEKIIKL